MGKAKSQLTKEQASKLFDSRFWETLSYRDRAMFQMNEARLCMPFGIFQEAMKKTLGRPIWTHEFGLNYDGLLKELLGENPSPTFEEILDLVPTEKLVLVGVI
jgi:hypothetical protein